MVQKSTESTRERIIEAAGDIFGRDGFKAATIRKIAQAAHVNVAAVNYHFGNKERLYRAVLDEIFTQGFKKFPSIPEFARNLPPEKRLQHLIRGMFHRSLSHDGWQGVAGKGRLIAREFFDPSPPFEDILMAHAKPHRDILFSILKELSQNKLDDESLFPIAVSIMGQCVYFAFAAPIIRRIAPIAAPTQDNLDRLADHVFRFSIGGIRQIISDQCSENGQGSP